MTTTFHDWIAHPELLNKETLFELRTLLARYPYFQAVRILYLKNLYILHDPSFGEELHKAALFISDKRALFYFVEGERYTIQPHQKEVTEETPDAIGGDRTLHLIDNFLAGLPEEATSDEGTASLSNDYLSYTLREEELPEQAETNEETTPMRGQELIDGFIEKADEGQSFRISAPEENECPTEENDRSGEEEEESYFTETLAKIYIKQKRYEKALEIIKKLSLKYPKKNSYFADQIRFLEKLIINSKSK